MGKKSKKNKKQNSVSDGLLDATALSIKKYRKVTNQLAKLSPGQKLVGGLLLLAGGYYYLKNLQHNDDWQDSAVAGLLPAWLPAARRPAYRAVDIEDAETEPGLPPRPRKTHKVPKPDKHAGAFGKKAAASPDEE